MRLTVGSHAPRHIRRIARSLLAGWGMPELSDAVELGVTELLTNVVRHVPDRRCTLLLLRQRTGVRVEVTDGSAELPRIPASLDDQSEGGRGLLLLDAVADKWGVSLKSGGGKTVWFECGAEVNAHPAARTRRPVLPTPERARAPRSGTPGCGV
ncbi:ATP-binding protein [Streptomyces sp. NPDC052693]|uniref:ATP-binding protein n=1 Tax=Streptomyces sp. NPDC052693 TaxID=3155814 RepID=UPI0034284F98